MSKHAYMIIVNSNLNVFGRCLRLIDDIRNDVFILVDSKSLKVSDVRRVVDSNLNFVSKCLVCEQIVNWEGVLSG